MFFMRILNIYIVMISYCLNYIQRGVDSWVFRDNYVGMMSVDALVRYVARPLAIIIHKQHSRYREVFKPVAGVVLSQFCKILENANICYVSLTQIQHQRINPIWSRD